MNKSKIKQISIMLIASIFLISCGQKTESIKEQEIIRVVKYEESTLNQDRIDLKFSGSLRSLVEALLSFKIGGTLEKIDANIGDRVKKGQVLAVLDKSSYNLQYQQAQASYEQAKAALLSMDSKIAEAKTGIAQAKTGIAQAKAAVEQAEAAYARALSVQENVQKEFERYKELYLNDSISQSDFDKIKSGLEQAKAAVEQAQGGINQAKAAYEQTLAQKEQTELLFDQANVGKKVAEAQLSAVEKQVELARLQLSYTELIAPIDGTIGLKLAEENENIGAGMPVLRIESENELEAEIYVSESVINAISTGDKAELYISSTDKKIEGTVTEIGSSSTGFGGTYAVKLNIDNQADNTLKSGMAVDVKLKTKTKENFITLPLNAINEDSKGSKFVYAVEDVKDEIGTVIKKEIQIGGLVNNRIEILSGIEEDEKIITAGTSRVIPGQKVRLYKEGK